MKMGLIGRQLISRETPEASRVEAQFEAARRLGVRHVDLWAPSWDEPGQVERVQELQERYQIDVHLGFGDDYIGHADRQPTEAFAELIERVCKPLGVGVIGTVSRLHGGRWLREPPLGEQLDRLAGALGRLAPIAEANGVVLAIENHADYRGYELAGVLDRIGSPGLGARLDTGNAYAVIEEPLAATEALARYTVATHIKDVVVESEPGNRGLTPGGLLALRWCVLGEGHVELEPILALLSEQSPPGNDLVLTLEVPRGTEAESLAYARRAFVSYLSE
jgi:sugar phosphate isomerase/epimerase